MGSMGSKVTKPIRNYNLEQRTEKVLKKAQEVPQSAPRHKTTEKLLSEFAREHPEFLESQHEKDDDLLSRLKMMKIDTSGMMPEIKTKAKSLPQERQVLPDYEFGHFEPAEIPEGKTSIRKATEFISQHSQDPKKYTAQILAEQNKLSIGDVNEVLKYFKVFNLYLPKKPAKKSGGTDSLEAGQHIRIGDSENK